jgi:hypothetical protein
MNQTNNLMVAIFVALGLIVVVGFVVLPAIDEAHARNAIASARNKGQQGFTQSGGQGGSDCGAACG